MKTAVIFYSLDGNCAYAAEEIKSLLNADLIRLHTKDEKERSGISKFFWSCGAMFSRPQLKPYSFDPSAYDLIILGAPVWAASPASPVKTFISKAGITGKKTALFVCHAGGKGKALEKFKALLAGNDIISVIDFLNPARNSGENVKRQIADWVNTIKG